MKSYAVSLLRLHSFNVDDIFLSLHLDYHANLMIIVVSLSHLDFVILVNRHGADIVLLLQLHGELADVIFLGICKRALKQCLWFLLQS